MMNRKIIVPLLVLAFLSAGAYAGAADYQCSQQDRDLEAECCCAMTVARAGAAAGGSSLDHPEGNRPCHHLRGSAVRIPGGNGHSQPQPGLVAPCCRLVGDDIPPSSLPSFGNSRKPDRSGFDKIAVLPCDKAPSGMGSVTTGIALSGSYPSHRPTRQPESRHILNCLHRC